MASQIKHKRSDYWTHVQTWEWTEDKQASQSLKTTLISKSLCVLDLHY